MNLKDKIKLFPHSPGVYRYYDSEGNVIYVGKAKDLNKRVAQYFVSPERLTRKTAVLVSKIADAEYTKSRIEDYLNGTYSTIEELEEPVMPYAKASPEVDYTKI